MAEPAYPSLEQEGKIGFEGIADQKSGGGGEGEGSFSVQFTPSAGEAAKQQLNDDPQTSYRTFEGGEPGAMQASSEDIVLLEKGTTTQSEKEKVRFGLHVHVHMHLSVLLTFSFSYECSHVYMYLGSIVTG